MTCDDDDYLDLCCCPLCAGMCSVDCNCGGDLCVCDNFGEMDCPMCHGEGEVSQDVWDRYHAKQSQMRNMIGAKP